MESLHAFLPRIEALNPFTFVALLFQPARRADWKVGVTAARFIAVIESGVETVTYHNASAQALPGDFTGRKSWATR